jgi:hypothetical protein
MTRRAVAHPEDAVTSTPRRPLARGVALLAGGLLLAACGGVASSSSTGTSAPAATSASPPATGDTSTGCGVGQQITVKGSTVTPPPSTLDVPAGCQVSLTITSDRTSEVHVHVVDLEKPITAGKPLTIEFTPTQQGVYEVELHDPDLLLVKLAVR